MVFYQLLAALHVGKKGMEEKKWYGKEGEGNEWHCKLKEEIVRYM